MCKSLYTYLAISFAFEKPRWLLHNTADRAETVFSHLKVTIKCATPSLLRLQENRLIYLGAFLRSFANTSRAIVRSRMNSSLLLICFHNFLLLFLSTPVDDDFLV